MPSLKAVRIRIASVKSTQKITRAMKLVAAAKLRRAQDAIVAARPYAQALSEAVAEIAARAGGDAHPMLQRRDGKRTAIIVLTSDRGLSGAFNTGISRAVVKYRDEGMAASTLQDLQLTVSGRKGVEYFRRRRVTVATELPGTTAETGQDRAKQLAQIATDAFMSGQVDRIEIAYNEFRSAVSQRAVIEPLLPIAPAAVPADVAQLDFAYEPSRQELLDLLLPLYIESRIYRAILESIASEFGAKMTAMENATNNANDMIERLTLQYNRARQAAITKELMEIVSGAEALNG